MARVLKARVFRNIGTESEWLAKNPVLLDGEVAYVRFGSRVRQKVGNGSLSFGELTYQDSEVKISGVTPSFPFVSGEGPAPEGVYMAKEDGIYHGVQVDVSGKIVFLLWDGVSELEVVETALPPAENKIENWAAKPYTAGQQAIDNNIWWEAVVNTTAAQRPGVAPETIWKRAVKEYALNDILYRGNISARIENEVISIAFSGTSPSVPPTLYKREPDNAYSKTLAVGTQTFELAHNGCLIWNITSNTLEVRGFVTDKTTVNEILLLVNIRGTLAGGKLAALVEYELNKTLDAKEFYYRDSASYSKSGTEITVYFTGQRRFYRLRRDKPYITLPTGPNYYPMPESVVLPHNGIFILDIETKAFAVSTILERPVKVNEVVLLINIDGKIVGGELMHLFSTSQQSGGAATTNAKGYELLPIPKGTWQSFTFVGEEIWLCYQSNDAHTNYGPIKRFSLQDYTLIGEINHNIGHMNTVDYNEVNDTLLIGNGSGDYNLPLKIFLFPNASSWRAQSTINFNTVDKIVIDLSEIPESKAQAVWGENNHGKNNIIYLITNDNKVIRKCLLGLGSNQFEYGQFIPGVAATAFNGTLRVLSRHSQNYDADVNQDSTFYNGKIYVATGHDGIQAHSFKLLTTGGVNEGDGGIEAVKIVDYPLYKDNGTKYTIYSEGLGIRNGMIYIGFISELGGIARFSIPN